MESSEDSQFEELMANPDAIESESDGNKRIVSFNNLIT